MKNLYLVFLFIILYNCNSQDNNIRKENTTVKSEISNNWKKDKDGCLKLRSKKLAENLIKDYNLNNKYKSDFRKVFGKPNKIEKENNQEVYVYYFDCTCVKGNIVKGSDKCYAEFYFDNDKFKDVIFICE